MTRMVEVAKLCSHVWYEGPFFPSAALFMPISIVRIREMTFDVDVGDTCAGEQTDASKCVVSPDAHTARRGEAWNTSKARAQGRQFGRTP